MEPCISVPSLKSVQKLPLWTLSFRYTEDSHLELESSVIFSDFREFQWNKRYSLFIQRVSCFSVRSRSESPQLPDTLYNHSRSQNILPNFPFRPPHCLRGDSSAGNPPRLPSSPLATRDKFPGIPTPRSSPRHFIAQSSRPQSINIITPNRPTPKVSQRETKRKKEKIG